MENALKCGLENCREYNEYIFNPKNLLKPFPLDLAIDCLMPYNCGTEFADPES